MEFFVVNSYYDIPEGEKNKLYLLPDNWNDWYKYETLYNLIYFDDGGKESAIGALKIGEFNQEDESPNIPQVFTRLDNRFFSLGQDDSYYFNIKILGNELRVEILSRLNDIAINSELYEKAIKEEVSQISLFRYVKQLTVKTQFRRLATGGDRLTEYQFNYIYPISTTKIDFHVLPTSNPPTNIHVIIGRNGVGKTYLINNMIKSLVDESALRAKVGGFNFTSDTEGLFTNVVSVSFSAFDESEPLLEKEVENKFSKLLLYSYVGLKKARTPSDGRKVLPPKTPTKLKNEFAKSAWLCHQQHPKKQRWTVAMMMLKSDPIFGEADVLKLSKISTKVEFETAAKNLFHKLSSGHKIVLLTITRLVETVEERAVFD